MIFLQGDDDLTGKVYCLGTYYPYRNGTNPNFDDFSDLLLNGFKKRQDPAAIDYFYQRYDALLGDGFAIAVVPSSNPATVYSSARVLAQMLASSNARIDATSCLVRHTRAYKRAWGGKRSQDDVLNTVRVAYANLIIGREVLLLDDVMATGNSLAACETLLLQAGARRVQQAVLGYTVR